MKISRDEFIEMWNEIGLDKVDLFNFDKGNPYKTAHFIINYDYELEEVSIINEESLAGFDGGEVIIGWYKMMHVGRSLKVVGVDSKEELKDYLIQLKEDFEIES